MNAKRPAVSGLLVVLAVITAPLCSAVQSQASSIAPPAAQEVQALGSGQAQATGIAPPAIHEAQAADLLAGFALPVTTEELGQISGGALTLISPEQLQRFSAGVKLWDEALMRPQVTTVESGPGQTQTSVSAQQTLLH